MLWRRVTQSKRGAKPIGTPLLRSDGSNEPLMQRCCGSHGSKILHSGFGFLKNARHLIESLNARIHVQCFVQGWPVHIRLPGSARVEDDSIKIFAPRGWAKTGGYGRRRAEGNHVNRNVHPLLACCFACCFIVLMKCVDPNGQHDFAVVNTIWQDLWSPCVTDWATEWSYLTLRAQLRTNREVARAGRILGANLEDSRWYRISAD